MAASSGSRSPRGCCSATHGPTLHHLPSSTAYLWLKPPPQGLCSSLLCRLHVHMWLEAGFSSSHRLTTLYPKLKQVVSFVPYSQPPSQYKQLARANEMSPKQNKTRLWKRLYLRLAALLWLGPACLQKDLGSWYKGPKMTVKLKAGHDRPFQHAGRALCFLWVSPKYIHAGKLDYHNADHFSLQGQKTSSSVSCLQYEHRPACVAIQQTKPYQSNTTPSIKLKLKKWKRGRCMAAGDSR